MSPVIISTAYPLQIDGESIQSDQMTINTKQILKTIFACWQRFIDLSLMHCTTATSRENDFHSIKDVQLLIPLFINT